MKRIPMLLLVTSLTACNPAEPSNNLDAQAAGQSLTADVQSDARDFARARDGKAAFAATCHTKNPANPADADLDGIPDELTAITYTNCPEGTLTMNGTQAITDGNSGSTVFNMQSIWSVTLTGTQNGETVSYDYDAVVDASESPAGTFRLNDAADVIMTIGGKTIEDEHVFSSIYLPNDGTWEPVPGAPLESGTIDLSGPWQNTVTEGGDQQIIGGVVNTTTILTIDTSCSTSITSGEVNILLSDPPGYEGQFLNVTWTGCGQTTSELTPLF